LGLSLLSVGANPTDSALFSVQELLSLDYSWWAFWYTSAECSPHIGRDEFPSLK